MTSRFGEQDYCAPIANALRLQPRARARGWGGDYFVSLCPDDKSVVIKRRVMRSCRCHGGRDDTVTLERHNARGTATGRHCRILSAEVPEHA